jgi:hypothetical protein
LEAAAVKIDQDYMRQLLNTFHGSPRPFVELSDFRKNDIDVDDKFLFHMQLLEDQELVECLSKEKKLGYVIAGGGTTQWVSRPLRLTAAGHEFAEALNKQEIWKVLKTGFKDASLSTLRAASKELLEALIKKQVKKHFGL